MVAIFLSLLNVYEIIPGTHIRNRLTWNAILSGLKALLELRSLLIHTGFPSNSINIGTIPDTITELSSTFGPDGGPDEGPDGGSEDGSAGGSVGGPNGRPDSPDGGPEDPEAVPEDGSEGSPESEESLANFLFSFVLPVILEDINIVTRMKKICLIKRR